MTDHETYEDSLESLEDSLAQTSGMVASFQQQLNGLQGTVEATSQSVGKFESSLSKGLSRAIDDVVLDGARLSDALQTVAQNMVKSAYKSAVRPVTDQVAQVLTAGTSRILGGVLPFADGAAMSQGRVLPFAKGGVVGGPTTFPMRGATGLMGEAGPEAIMPLTRGSDGKLGVAAHGGAQPVTVVMNITTPDAQSFQRSKGQIAAQMQRALARGQRNR